MKKDLPIGGIVWGIILIVIGGIGLLYFAAFLWLSFVEKTTGKTVVTSVIGMIIYFLILSGGLVLLITGIIQRKRTIAYNEELEAYKEANKRKVAARCFKCGYVVYNYDIYFQFHTRYPEGFVYCPYCRQPLSRNLFNYAEESPQETGAVHHD